MGDNLDVFFKKLLHFMICASQIDVHFAWSMSVPYAVARCRTAAKPSRAAWTTARKALQTNCKRSLDVTDLNGEAGAGVGAGAPAARVGRRCLST